MGEIGEVEEKSGLLLEMLFELEPPNLLAESWAEEESLISLASLKQSCGFGADDHSTRRSSWCNGSGR